MKIAIVPAGRRDARALARFDRRTFPNTEDHAPPSYFSERNMRSFWLLSGRKRIGACTMIRHATLTQDPYALSQAERGTLYIVSTALLPEHRGTGLASVIKAWQIAYARTEGFGKIITNARESNAASIALNMKFGFKKTARIEGYYPDGEAAVILELTPNPP